MAEPENDQTVVQAVNEDAPRNLRHNKRTALLLGAAVLGVLFIGIVWNGNHPAKQAVAPSVPATGREGDTLKKAEALTAERLKQLGIAPPPAQAAPSSTAQAPADAASVHTPRAHSSELSATAREAFQARQQLMQAPMMMNVQTVTPPSGSDTLSAAPGSAVPLSGYDQFAQLQPKRVATAQAEVLHNPDWTLAQGDFLHAVLNVAISSEIQGAVTASVTRPVYSYTGQRVLIPVGSRLVGHYAQTGAGGNGMAASRVFVVWNRVLTPDGVSVILNAPSTDTVGRNGQGADAIDTHFWNMFGTSLLISIIGAGAANTNNSANATGMNAAQQYQSAVQMSLASTANSVLGRSTHIQPTLYIHQGTLINVFINKDVDLYGALHQG